MLSLLMRKGPTLAVLSTWVPPQNSMDTPPISTTRTTSPYFSPNMATAPFFLASSMGSTSVTTGIALQNGVVDQLIHLRQLLRRDGLESG